MDDIIEGPTTAEIILGFFTDIEGIFAQITDDDDLTDDQKAGLIQMFEDIEQYRDDAKEFLGVSSENDT